MIRRAAPDCRSGFASTLLRLPGGGPVGSPLPGPPRGPPFSEYEVILVRSSKPSVLFSLGVGFALFVNVLKSFLAVSVIGWSRPVNGVPSKVSAAHRGSFGGHRIGRPVVFRKGHATHQKAFP